MSANQQVSGEIIPPVRDWAAMGIRWDEEQVAKGTGSEKVYFHTMAQIPVVVDVEKFRAAVGDEALAGMLDGSGVRIPAQDVNRRELAKNTSAVVIRELVWSRLIGLRVRSAPTPKIVEVKVRVLINGAKFDGKDEVEFRAANMAAAIDLGMSAEQAKMIASTIAW